MKAIQVKYLSPTNTKGSRIKAFAADLPAIVESLDYSMDIETQSRYMATRLANKYSWLTNPVTGDVEYYLVAGTLPNGDYCYVIEQIND